MQHRSKGPVDTAALSKKYKCDINKIIKAWKNGKNDFELSNTLGIDTIKLMQIRQDIAFIHEKHRQQRLKNNYPSKTSILFKPW
jgi:hypothetical protein